METYTAVSSRQQSVSLSAWKSTWAGWVEDGTVAVPAWAGQGTGPGTGRSWHQGLSASYSTEDAAAAGCQWLAGTTWTPLKVQV